jgi:hypothetical protein
MKRVAFVLLFVAMCGFVYAGGSDASGIRVTLLSPHAGDVLTPGQRVTIAWEVSFPIKGGANFREQEIRLSLDGGQTFEHWISPSFDANVRSYVWTVPALESDHCVLDLRYGSLTGPEFEVSNPQHQAEFRIVSTPPDEGTGVHVTQLSPAAGAKLTPGTQVIVSWRVDTSAGARKFQEQEVRLSIDGGATFHYPISGSLDANARSFLWTVPNTVSDHCVLDIRYGNLAGPELEVSNPQHGVEFSIAASN